MAEPDLARLASLQHSLVTRRQARDHLTREELNHRLATGRLLPHRWGVYQFAGAMASEWQPLMAACLAAGPDAVVSHRSAAVLWAMGRVVSEEPEVTAPWPHWPRLPGVLAHRSTNLPAEHCTIRHGVPVTTPARTLADLSAVLPGPFLGRVVDGCVRRGLVSFAELRAVHEALATRGRQGLKGLEEVLQRRPDRFNPGGSGGELDLLEVLAAAGLPLPVPQYEVLAGGTVYVLDYAYPDPKVGLEYDGWGFHRLPSDLDHAAERNNALELEGWRMLHFTESSGPSRIVATVGAALARSRREKRVSDPNLRDCEAG